MKLTLSGVATFIVLTGLAVLYSCKTTASDSRVESFAVPDISFEPRSHIVYRAGEPIKVDGRLDEQVWTEAAWTENFVDILGGDQEVDPKHRTRVKLLWDRGYLYIGAELEEEHIWATMTERNSPLYLDNALEIFVDPDGDTHNYVEFQINALGTIWDLYLNKPYRDGGHGLSQWNMLDYKAVVDLDGEINSPGSGDEGWSVEVALPVEALLEAAPGKSSVENGDQWRVNFARAQRRLEVVDGEYQLKLNPDTDRPYGPDFYTWSPQGLNNIHYPEMWGTIQFSDNVVGQETDKFYSNPQENIKWALRQVYYKMRTFYATHGYYTDDISQINTDEIKVEGFSFKPELKTTSAFFEVSCRGSDNNTIWYISQDGRVWQE